MTVPGKSPIWRQQPRLAFPGIRACVRACVYYVCMGKKIKNYTLYTRWCVRACCGRGVYMQHSARRNRKTAVVWLRGPLNVYTCIHPNISSVSIRTYDYTHTDTVYTRLISSLAGIRTEIIAIINNTYIYVILTAATVNIHYISSYTVVYEIT